MPNIIISFTSYPKRIRTINKVLDCIVSQTILPSKIILYLSYSQFAGYGKIPDFSSYRKYGFEISWHEEDLGPHKKYYYSLQEYPDDIVITIDDDFCYKTTMIEELLRFHKKYPRAIIARRAHLITWEKDGNIAPYEKWYGECPRYIGVPRMDLVATGCGGILYPPHIFTKNVFDKSIFMKKAPYADDLWLKIMELYNNIPTVLATRFFDDPEIEGYTENGLYSNYNANGGNDVQLNSLFNLYNKDKGENYFIKKLRVNKMLLCEDCKREKKNDSYIIINEFFKIIDNQEKVLIYGAGNVAKRIYRIFRKTGRLNKIDSFIVKFINENEEELYEIKVKNYKDVIFSKKKIIIGLWDTKQDEVYKELIRDGISEERIIKLPLYINRLLEFVSEDNEWNGSADYWERRYIKGGNSGSGSYNRLAEFKADVLNKFVEENTINLVLEWGCGDGSQLALAKYPEYIGYDVSIKAIEICKEKFEKDLSKSFVWCGKDDFISDVKGDLSISLDVIYHLIEDEVFYLYMDRLFKSSKKYICIYSCNYEKNHAKHVKCRKFTDYIEAKYKEWRQIEYIANKYPYDEQHPDDTSWSDFYFYKKLDKNK